jgi:hypothetical protein
MLKKGILLFFHFILTLLLIYYVGDFASQVDDIILSGAAISILMILWFALVIHIGKFVFYLIINKIEKK